MEAPLFRIYGARVRKVLYGWGKENMERNGQEKRRDVWTSVLCTAPLWIMNVNMEEKMRE